MGRNWACPTAFAQMKRNHYWTPDEEEKLRGLANKGMHYRAVALRMRRSESSIKKRANELGIKVVAPPRGCA
jgi:hypothetical protein